MSGRSISAAIATFLVLGTALPAMAFVIQQGQTITISDTLRDDLYATGETVLVTGNVDGDVAAAARNIAIGGKVTGGVLAAGQDVRIGGIIGRTVRAAGQSVSIVGTIGIDAIIAGGEVNIPQQVRIGRDLLVAGREIHMAADIGRYARVVGDTVVIGGKIGKGLRVDARRLTILSTARIDGDVRYSAIVPIDLRPGAQITGKTERVPRPPQSEYLVYGIPFDVVLRFWEALGLLLIGLVVATLAPRGSREVATSVLRRFPLSLLAGFILLVVVPLVAIALSITIIGIPLAVAVMFLLAAVVYPSQMFVAAAIGRILLVPFGRKKVRPVSTHLTVGIGTVILALLFAIPFGWLVRLAAMVLGAGALGLTLWRSMGGWRKISAKLPLPALLVPPKGSAR